MQMFHYIDTEQWDAIISSADLNYNNYLHLNCLNLALSHKGVMQTDLFKYPQSGIQSLVSKYQAHIEESFLFSQIYYHVGITSLAYNFAFGTSVGITYGSPVMTKLLIKSHLIYGQYPRPRSLYHYWKRHGPITDGPPRNESSYIMTKRWRATRN